MRKFRIIGEAPAYYLGQPWFMVERAMIIHAHSSLDAGARWKADPDFYSIGTLKSVEDLGYDEKTKAKKTAVIIPFKALPAKAKITTAKHSTGKVGNNAGSPTQKRERANARIQFGF